jgi:tetratricopeptide (TPR) repeat protein
MATSCDRNTLLRYGLGRLNTTETADVRRHVADCPKCAAYLATVQAAPDGFAPVHSIIVDELLSRPDTQWASFFEKHRERFLNFEAVQALIQACEDRWDRDPKRADTLSVFLTDSADALPATFAARALQSIAWTRRATMHLRLARPSEALAAVDEAKARASDIPVADYERALIAFTSADILRDVGRTDEALAEIRGAAAVFASFRDQRRLASAREMEGAVLCSQGEYKDALAIFLSLNETAAIDRIIRGRSAANAAHCFVKLGDPAQAVPLFGRAEGLFRELDHPNYLARIAWGKARALRSASDDVEAIAALRDVLRQFEALGAMTEWVRAGLELIEWLLPTEAFEEVRILAHEVHSHAKKAGLQLQALEAIEYLRTASVRDALTANRAQYVRNFIEDLRSSPDAIFSPPQDIIQ